MRSTADAAASFARIALSGSPGSYSMSPLRPLPPVTANCGCLRTNECIAPVAALRATFLPLERKQAKTMLCEVSLTGQGSPWL
jgi:hypothetical protein